MRNSSSRNERGFQDDAFVLIALLVSQFLSNNPTPKQSYTSHHSALSLFASEVNLKLDLTSTPQEHPLTHSIQPNQHLTKAYVAYPSPQILLLPTSKKNSLWKHHVPAQAPNQDDYQNRIWTALELGSQAFEQNRRWLRSRLESIKLSSCHRIPRLGHMSVYASSRDTLPL